MTFLDRFLQRRRIQKAKRFIPVDSVVLDIGCHQGELFTALGAKLRYGVGVDPVLEKDVTHQQFELLKDFFPSPRAVNKIYHCIVMLAVLEHIKPAEQSSLVDACYHCLHQDGKLILTVPDKRADRILTILQKFGLVKGMQLHEHFGFDVSQIPALFARGGFELVVHKKFQLGLNNLFVFKK